MWSLLFCLSFTRLVWSFKSIESCCSSLNNSNKLIYCINSTLTSNYRYNHEKNNEYYIGPRFSLSILTRITPEIYSYAAYSYMIQAYYAEINHYIQLPLFPDSSNEDYILHRKLVPILELLEEGNSQIDSDYIVWIDADAIILQTNYRLEQVCAQYPLAHLIISEDVSSIANSGVMIFRNSQWSIDFIKLWLSYREKYGTDQLGFESAYYYCMNDNKRSSNKNKIKIVPAHILNSDAPAMTTHTQSHPVLHLAMESKEYRGRVMSHLAQQVCDNVHVDVDLDDVNNIDDVQGQIIESRNLHISGGELLAIAVETYGPAALNMLDMLKTDLDLFLVQSTLTHTNGEGNSEFIEDTGEQRYIKEMILLMTLRERWTSDLVSHLRINTSKYAYATQHYGRIGSLSSSEHKFMIQNSDAFTMQQEAHQLVAQLCNLLLKTEMIRSSNSQSKSNSDSDNGDMDRGINSNNVDSTICQYAPSSCSSHTLQLTHHSHLPEILKFSAELSFEYLLEMIEINTDTASSVIHNNDIQKVSQYISCTLKILQSIVASHQRELVNSMISDLNEFCNKNTYACK